MTMSAKIFSERLNHELDNIGLPERESERVDAFAKLFHIPKYKAEGYLQGLILPDQTLMQIIADELEVDPHWLAGKA